MALAFEFSRLSATSFRSKLQLRPPHVSLVFGVFAYQLLDVYAPEPLKLSCVVSPGARIGKIKHSVQFGHQLFARSENFAKWSSKRWQ